LVEAAVGGLDEGGDGGLGGVAVFGETLEVVYVVVYGFAGVVEGGGGGFGRPS